MAEERICFLHEARLESMPDVSELRAEIVNLNHNSIGVIHEEYIPRSCKKFYIARNYIHSDGLPFEWPEGIEEINLEGNKIQETDGVRWPESLKELNLNENPLEFWPQQIPEGLKVLSIEWTNLVTVESLPSGLQVLRANRSSLKELPTSMPEGLKELYAYHACLRSNRLPYDWGSQLRVLDLEHNFLTRFPEFLPSSLEYLFLGKNKITEVTTDLPTSLIYLNLMHNSIRKFSVPSRKTPVRILCLQDNQLTDSVDPSVALEIYTNENWNTNLHRKSANQICKVWRRYRLQKRLRAFRKTKILKEELQQVSMHPCRAGQYEDISPEWGWGC